MPSQVMEIVSYTPSSSCKYWKNICWLKRCFEVSWTVTADGNIEMWFMAVFAEVLWRIIRSDSGNPTLLSCEWHNLYICYLSKCFDHLESRRTINYELYYIWFCPVLTYVVFEVPYWRMLLTEGLLGVFLSREIGFPGNLLAADTIFCRNLSIQHMSRFFSPFRKFLLFSFF